MYCCFCYVEESNYSSYCNWSVHTYHASEFKVTIDHLHASENILIAFLIAVTSRLDAVVTCINVL